MLMALIMMSIMHFVIKWSPVTPTGFMGMVFLFVGRGFIAFHHLPIIRRPYGTLK